MTTTDQPGLDGIELRLMRAEDVGAVPLVHQGTADEVLRRIEELGTSAVLAFDDGRHVAQLQVRPYEPGTRSPDGLDDPLYWMDFADRSPSVPDGAVAVFCYHVGQVDDSDERDPAYWGRGLGLALLDALLAWADDTGLAVVAKGVPEDRAVMTYLGGQPASAYEARGFAVAAAWVDEDLRALVERDGLGSPDVSSADRALVSCCVRLPVPGSEQRRSD